jgi:hypothetical protein
MQIFAGGTDNVRVRMMLELAVNMGGCSTSPLKIEGGSGAKR